MARAMLQGGVPKSPVPFSELVQAYFNQFIPVDPDMESDMFALSFYKF